MKLRFLCHKVMRDVSPRASFGLNVSQTTLQRSQSTLESWWTLQGEQEASPRAMSYGCPLISRHQHTSIRSPSAPPSRLLQHNPLNPWNIADNVVLPQRLGDTTQEVGGSVASDSSLPSLLFPLSGPLLINLLSVSKPAILSTHAIVCSCCLSVLFNAGWSFIVDVGERVYSDDAYFR